MSDAPPLRIVLLAAPEAPGARAVLDRAHAAQRGGRRLALLLSGAGLAWIEEDALASLAEARDVSVGLCSRSAREHGLVPDALPPWIRWTSLVAYFTALEPEAELWGVLP